MTESVEEQRSDDDRNLTDDGTADGTAEADEEGEGADAEEDVYTAPKLSEGVGEVVSRPKEWFFLMENRLLVAGMVLVGLFAGVAAIDALLDVGTANLSPLYYVFSGLIGGNLTLITIVVSINQLVVSRHLNTPGGLREEIQGVNEYREAVEEAIPHEVAPVTPSDFLQTLLEGTEKEIEETHDAIDEVGDEEAREGLEDLLDDLGTNIGHTDHVLQESDVGIFEALSVTLRTNYSEEIYRIRDLQTSHGDRFSPELDDALDNLVLRIQQIDVARQYFKTLYLQDELSYLSRILLYTGVPAELASIGMLLLFAGVTPVSLSAGTLSVLIPVAVAVAMAPLAVLFAFILRISVVIQRTAAITPFTTAEQERPGELIGTGDGEQRLGD